MPEVTPGFKAAPVVMAAGGHQGLPCDLGTLYRALWFSGLWAPFLRSFCERSLRPS